MKNAISAGHEITLEVAREILHSGGNAFDAATAAFFAMFIAEPCMASAGGNGFALAKPAVGKIRYFDFFSQTPNQKHIENPDFYPIQVDFGDETEEFHIGLASAAVPGSIAGILEIHQHFGSIPIEELIQPACILAKEGVVLNEFQAYDISLLASIIVEDPRGKDIFFNGHEIKKEGERIHMPYMADFLDFITREGKRGFYEGEIARTIVSDSQSRGGFLTMEDFAQYEVITTDPLCFDYYGKNVYVPNSPNNGGVSLALFLGTSTKKKLALHLAIKSSQNALQNKEELNRLLNELYPNNNYSGLDGPKSHRGTSHLNILDKMGNAISLSSSIGEGSGYFIPGTDMQLNNMLGELYLLPGGKHSWETNTRLESMMTPTIITDRKDKVELLAGSGGASRIPYAVGQVIHHHLFNKLSLQESIDHPRYHHQNNKFQVEAGAEWNEKDPGALFWNKKSLYFGGVHAISVFKDKVEAAGDPRRFGVAAVFD